MQTNLLSTAPEATEIPLTEKLVIVHLDFRQWTGTTVFKESDFQIGDNGRLPPKAIIRELGSKNIIDPKSLERFNTIKQRARALLEQNGVPFMGGWGIPLDRAEEILKELKAHADEYESEKAEFLKNYDKKVEEWISQNPDFETQLRSAVKTAFEVDSRIYARFTAVRVAPVCDNDGLEAEVGSLGDRLLKSIAQAANRLLIESLSGKQNDGVTQRPVGTLRKMREKLIGLQFLNDGITPLVNMIDETIRRIPKSGKIIGPAFWLMQGCVSILSDIGRMKAIASGALTLDQWTANLSPDAVKDEAFTLCAEVAPVMEAQPVQTPEPAVAPALESVPVNPAAQMLENLKKRFEADAQSSLFGESNESATQEAPKQEDEDHLAFNAPFGVVNVAPEPEGFDATIVPPELYNVPPAPPAIEQSDSLFF